jgi:hypothetical protein
MNPEPTLGITTPVSNRAVPRGAFFALNPAGTRSFPEKDSP